VNVHHIVPEADGGPNVLENAIALCFTCHAEAGHYNPRHPLGTKYSPEELRKHRDDWWEQCGSSHVSAKLIDQGYFEKQHQLIFASFDADAKGLRRQLLAKGRYDSTYGMRELKNLVNRYVSDFLQTVRICAEKEGCDLASSSFSFKELLEKYRTLHQTFAAEKLRQAYPRRVGSLSLENIVNEAAAGIDNLYSKVILELVGFQETI
jgi:hypothetical protein